MTVHFSKTERMPDGRWIATIAPMDRKKVVFQLFDQVTDGEFVGQIFDSEGHEIKFICLKKFPCVGREYTIERK